MTRLAAPVLDTSDVKWQPDGNLSNKTIVELLKFIASELILLLKSSKTPQLIIILITLFKTYRKEDNSQNALI